MNDRNKCSVISASEDTTKRINANKQRLKKGGGNNNRTNNKIDSCQRVFNKFRNK